MFPVEPRRHFEIVFKMIDVDGNDTIDIEEFDMVILTLFTSTYYKHYNYTIKTI